MTKLRNGSQVTTRPTRKAIAGTAGYFSESNESGEPSYPGQDWFNDVIDEIVQAVTAADVTYDPTKITNLKSTVEALRNASNLNAGTVSMTHLNVTESTSDATLGKLLKVGDFGLGSGQRGDISLIDFLNNGLEGCFAVDSPSAPADRCTILSFSGGGAGGAQIGIARDGDQIFFRRNVGGASYSEWVGLFHDANISEISWLGTPVGGLVSLATHLSSVQEPPTDSAKFRYIKLSVSDFAYNGTALSSELISGTAPLLVATAVISDVSSPLNGETVHLLNTEGAFIRSGDVSGVAEFDQMQKIVGTWSNSILREITVNTGAMAGIGPASTNGSGGGPTVGYGINFDSSNSPNSRASSTSNGETRPRYESRVYYMRIR
ncbi:hypothetical protein A8139_00660 [Marinomonas primoryensis]|uniref:Phage tail collar domain-containing protein n=1 Tax=Marinomonas primoryensis TaxID=178399 RepID=A0A2Z4PM97_9GAMM|nr:hypothetical protein [Marinomonas primoryensis]AWX98572.1 hypothetical protein A8139_00145 [Marinomonas primoryensis]AWX98664.1 hypothetical protein A8139_00660 [Marinomonas primoryensis]